MSEHRASSDAQFEREPPHPYPLPLSGRGSAPRHWRCRVLNDAFHRPAQRPRRHRSRSRGTEGGESGQAGARRIADARRLLHYGGCVSPADSASRTHRRASRIPERRSADATPAVGRDQAETLSERSRARPVGGHPRRMVGRAEARGGALLGADRGSRRYQFRRPVRKFSRRQRRHRIPHHAARLLGGAVDHQRAPLHGAARSRSRRHRHGGAGAAAGRRARFRRGFKRNRRRPHAAQRHLGARLRHRARRSGAGPRRAQPPRFCAQQRSRPQASSRSLRAWRRHAAAGGARRDGPRAVS